MKRLILIGVTLFFTILANGQSKINIIGRWQAESQSITSMYHDMYQFYNDGRFVFSPDAYNGLNRILSINGHYKIKVDTILLTPEYTKELIGGFPIRSESTTLSDTWEIVQGKIKIIPCKKTKQIIAIKINSNKIILLDDRKFFKISP